MLLLITVFTKYKKEIVISLTSFIIFLFLAIYITYPLIFHMGDMATGFGDELVIAWIQNWVIHSLFTNPSHIFNTNLYFPYHNTLAYSDLFFTSSILSIIPLKIVGEPIAVVNFTFISSLVLLGFSIYLLSFYLTKDFLASLLSGIIVIFSPAVMDKATHLQILAIQWVPLSILFFLVFLRSQRSKYLAVALLFFLLQVYNSFLPGYFILFSYIIIFIYYWIYKTKYIKKLIQKKNISLFILSIVLIVPIALPYYQVSKEFNYVRDIRDSIHFALQPEDLMYPSNHTILKDYLLSLPFNKFSQNNEFKPGYLGLVFSILTIFAIYYFIKNFRKKNIFINSFATISLVGLILSLGPVLHLGRHTIHKPFPIPLPYALFYYILPGYQGFRNSARWEMLFILTIAITITLILHKILNRYSLRTQAIIYLFLIIGAIAEFNFPTKFVNTPQKREFPEVFTWINSLPQNASLIIMPAYNWNNAFAEEEMKREYFSTVNFRGIVNGYTGFSPPPWQEFLVILQNKFPEDESIKLLKDKGVSYIIVDREGYDKNFKSNQIKYDGEFIVKALQNNTSLHLVKKLGNYYVFKLIRL